jgi:hypothetical protein
MESSQSINILGFFQSYAELRRFESGDEHNLTPLKSDSIRLQNFHKEYGKYKDKLFTFKYSYVLQHDTGIEDNSE